MWLTLLHLVETQRTISHPKKEEIHRRIALAEVLTLAWLLHLWLKIGLYLKLIG